MDTIHLATSRPVPVTGQHPALTPELPVFRMALHNMLTPLQTKLQCSTQQLLLLLHLNQLDMQLQLEELLMVSSLTLRLAPGDQMELLMVMKRKKSLVTMVTRADVVVVVEVEDLDAVEVVMEAKDTAEEEEVEVIVVTEEAGEEVVNVDSMMIEEMIDHAEGEN